MITIVEIEKLALDLPEEQRAASAARLLDSLQRVLSDEDQGVAEALRRNAEIDADPDQAISLSNWTPVSGSAWLMRQEYQRRRSLTLHRRRKKSSENTTKGGD